MNSGLNRLFSFLLAACLILPSSPVSALRVQESGESASRTAQLKQQLAGAEEKKARSYQESRPFFQQIMDLAEKDLAEADFLRALGRMELIHTWKGAELTSVEYFITSLKRSEYEYLQAASDRSSNWLVLSTARLEILRKHEVLQRSGADVDRALFHTVAGKAYALKGELLKDREALTKAQQELSLAIDQSVPLELPVRELYDARKKVVDLLRSGEFAAVPTLLAGAEEKVEALANELKTARGFGFIDPEAKAFRGMPPEGIAAFAATLSDRSLIPKVKIPLSDPAAGLRVLEEFWKLRPEATAGGAISKSSQVSRVVEMAGTKRLSISVPYEELADVFDQVDKKPILVVSKIADWNGMMASVGLGAHWVEVEPASVELLEKIKREAPYTDLHGRKSIYGWGSAGGVNAGNAKQLLAAGDHVGFSVDPATLEEKWAWFAAARQPSAAGAEEDTRTPGKILRQSDLVLREQAITLPVVNGLDRWLAGLGNPAFISSQQIFDHAKAEKLDPNVLFYALKNRGYLSGVQGANTLGWRKQEVDPESLQGVQIRTVEDLAAEDAALPAALGLSGKRGIVLLPVEAPQPRPQERFIDLYAHESVAAGGMKLLPDEWTLGDFQIFPRNNLDRSNELLLRAAESAKGRTAIVALDAAQMEGLSLPERHPLTLLLKADPASWNGINPRLLATFVEQLRDRSLILDLTAGSIRIVTIRNRDYYALDIDASA